MTREEMTPEELNFYSGQDYSFENSVVWGVEESNTFFNYSVDKNISVDWDAPLDDSLKIDERVPLSDREIQESLGEFPPAPEERKEEQLRPDSLNLPPQNVKQQAYISGRRIRANRDPDSKKASPLDLLKMSFFKEKKEEDFKSSNESDQDFIEEQHKLMKEQQEGEKSMDYNVKDFPLADSALIQKLCEEHIIFFNLLSKLQETHTPTDFTTAFHIQDRIAYLLDNQTLLYKELTKKLIKYLEKINTKLKKYYDEITLKQEDLKKINAQISRFNEYDRKTQTRIDQAEKETKWFKEDLKEYQEHLEDLSGKRTPIEVPTEPNSEYSKN